MNKLWKTYGCTKCENYQLLVITANHEDSKSTFKKDFIDKYKVETICIPKETGGKEFDIALKNQKAGGPVYMIYPDKKFKEVAGEKDIIAAGIKPHNCQTMIKGFQVSPIIQKSYIWIQDDILNLSIEQKGIYQISLFNSNGQLLKLFPSQYFTPGTYKLNTFFQQLSPKLYVFVIESSGIKISKKIISKSVN